MMVTYLQKKGVILLKQAAYSPDFNLMGQWVFSHMERNCCYLDFIDQEDVKNFLTMDLRMIENDDLLHQFKTLQEDLRLVVERGGDYL